MRGLVTGVAGFIGSNLAEHLIERGWSIRGVDCLTDYYEPADKRRNLTALLTQGAFDMVDANLLSDPIEPMLADVDVVFHLAGQPGVRLSWADGFSTYTDLNVQVTQRLLEAARNTDLRRFVLASSSSVYGQTEEVPTPETARTRPYSPYGVTKLAAEHLCAAYGQNFGIPTVTLRYFTVYGPRQRPDMAFRRMIDASLDRRAFDVYGDGTQVRDFTYVGDVVDATRRAADAATTPGTIINVAGDSSTRLLDVVEVVGEVAGRPLDINWMPSEPGDVFETGGDVTLARRVLQWSPRTSLADGIAAQFDWQRTLR